MALDLETERKLAQGELTPADVATEEPIAEATEFTSQGPVPEVAADGSAKESASELAFDEAYNLDSGCHEWDIYKAACEQGSPSKWKPDYIDGFTSSSAFKGPSHHGKPHTFELAKGKSASSALREFMAGLTVTDWFTYHMGVDLLDLLDDMGFQAFDRMFGSDNDQDRAIPESHRLVISSALDRTTWVEDMRKIAFSAPEPDASVTEMTPAPQEEEEVAEEKKEAESEAVPADEMMVTEREREQTA